MARIVDKLSPVQLERLCRGRSAFRDVADVRIVSMMGQEEEPVLEATLAEVLDDLVSWCAEQAELIREHAEGQGRGAWRYAVRVVRREDGRAVGSTWCRVVVRASDGDDEASLDGSVGSYVQQLQRSVETSQRMLIEQGKLLQGTLEAQTKMMTSMWDRQRLLENERAEVVAASLQDAVERHGKPASGGGDEMMLEMLRVIGPALGDKLAEKLAPVLEPLVKSFLPESTDAASTEDDHAAE